MGFNGIYPLVICYITMERSTIETMGTSTKFRLGHGFKFARCKRWPGRVAVHRWTMDGIWWFTSIIGSLLDFQQPRLCRCDPMAHFFWVSPCNPFKFSQSPSSIVIYSFIYLIDLHLIDLHLIDLHGVESIIHAWDFFGGTLNKHPRKLGSSAVARMIQCQYHLNGTWVKPPWPTSSRCVDDLRWT